ncbi:MAG: hypothetical protein KGL39_14805 [Patescibacteria group bacterium]|nr:hypothetical protein [Patescibacteria group bacterium]
MNPTVALALIALLQREVNLLELQLAQLQASSTAIVATTTPGLTSNFAPYVAPAQPTTPATTTDVTATTFTLYGITYPGTAHNMGVLNDIEALNMRCAASMTGGVANVLNLYPDFDRTYQGDCLQSDRQYDLDQLTK